MLLHGQIHLDRITADQWPIWRMLRLNALEDAPEAFGSKLADWQGEGDHEARWRDRLSAVPANFVAYLDGDPIGMASGTDPDEDGSIELISMWVAPIARGRRVSDTLIRAVLDWARQQGASRVMLHHFETNLRAAALYRRHRFVDVGSFPCPDLPGCTERRMMRDLAL